MEFLKEEILRLVSQCDGRVSVRIELNGEAIDIKGNNVYSSASLIKIPILLEGFRQVEAGKLQLDRVYEVKDEEKVGGAGVIQAFHGQNSYSLLNLMTLMIIVSDNTATNRLIDIIGMDSINSCISSLDLKHTVINRKMMDFISLQQGKDNLTTAADIVACLRKIEDASFLTPDSREKILGILHHQQLLDKLPALIDHKEIWIANKTGELPGVEHDCAILKYKGKTLYVAVLVDQLRDKKAGRAVISEIGKMCQVLLTTR
jgi:beta-lactamase class A